MKNKSDKLKQLLNSPTYRLAYDDADFIRREDMRGTRLQQEYNKTELSQKEQNIKNTIVLFGSARTKEEDSNYQSAVALAQLIASECEDHTLICSGGGPGIMEAANRGAELAGKKSIGLNIELPHEQEPNLYISPELCFNFHYFAIRKMHFLKRAKALVAFPGGFGTFDELFESLTLIQTGRMKPIPIILFNQSWWEKIVNFEAFVEAKTISPKDLDLFEYAETAEEAWGKIQNHPDFMLET